MAVERSFGIFDIGEVLANRWITVKQALQCFRAIPYLFEVIGNEAPPDSGTQEKVGHDHSGNFYTLVWPDLSTWQPPGGRPITRGGVGALSGGRSPLYSQAVTQDWLEMDYGESPQRAMSTSSQGATNMGCTLMRYASPGIDTQATGKKWEARLRVYWPATATVPAQVKIANMDASYDILNPIQNEVVSVEIQPGTALQEITMLIPVRQDWWNRLMLWGRKKENDGVTTNLQIYDIVITETTEESLPDSSGSLRYK